MSRMSCLCQPLAGAKTRPHPDHSSLSFLQCGIDICGPFSDAPSNVKYMIIAVDYFTKWVEAKQLASITPQKVLTFVYDHIITRFGMPNIIVTDNGLIYHDLYLGEKALVERENVGFDLTKSNLRPRFVKDLTAKGVGLRVVDFHTGNHRKDGFTLLETIRRLNYSADNQYSTRGGANDEGSSPSTKSVSNEAPVIDAEPLTAVHPSEFAKNIGDSNNAPSENDEITLIGHSVASKAQTRKVAFGDASDPMDVNSDPNIHEFPSAKELKGFVDYHWVVSHVTPPPWKQHLKEISLEKLRNIHDKAYMQQAILENMEVEKDKAYIKLERKCNEALQDLDKNHLVLDMRYEINTLQGQVDMLHGEYSRLVLEEKKWVNYEQTLSILRSNVEGLENERERLKSSETQLLQEIDRLRQDRAVVVSKVVPHVATKLVRSDEMGLLVSRLVMTAMFCGRCTSFEEVVVLKKPFDLEKMHGYRSSSKKEFDQAGDDLATASYPFIAEATVDPYASLEELLLKKPKFLRTKPVRQTLSLHLRELQLVEGRYVAVILTIQMAII
ncbi:reverse transcriptase domain-containing protein [Tanacetum coccineum]